MTISHQATVGETVAQDYRAAAVFEKYGIDFCCKGQLSIDEACERKKVLPEDVIRDLKLLNTTQGGIRYEQLSLSDLADHIEGTHHRYIREKSPLIQRYLDKICAVHGDRHPELYEINQLFAASQVELANHMKKEELILFPRIRATEQSAVAAAGINLPITGILKNPIAMMMTEHETEGDRFHSISVLTHGYQPPADACNTFRVTYGLLQEFEHDLHLHIHLENNILFPKAMRIEKDWPNLLR
ncbi:MAG TPA: iron-sulfur cluster repair di-iron protein [Saprospiraceae bacterium]|nr:iron-sulfur cluster repair di-iron protein [Saprospiraceae bacterium]